MYKRQPVYYLIISKHFELYSYYILCAVKILYISFPFSILSSNFQTYFLCYAFRLKLLYFWWKAWLITLLPMWIVSIYQITADVRRYEYSELRGVLCNVKTRNLAWITKKINIVNTNLAWTCVTLLDVYKRQSYTRSILFSYKLSRLSFRKPLYWLFENLKTSISWSHSSRHFVWGCMKSLIYSARIGTQEKLRHRIIEAGATVKLSLIHI